MKQNKEKGITLIALVITIIVLLILAGVAISTLTGDSGILTKAVKAKDATRGGEVKEYVRIAVTENAMVDSTNGTKRTRAEVISELSTQGKLTPKEVRKLTDEEKPLDIIVIGGIEVDFSKLGPFEKILTLVEMYDKAAADGCTNSDGACKDASHLHIGDYVKYKNPTTGSYTALASKTGFSENQTYKIAENQLQWRCLGKDSNTNRNKISITRIYEKSM